MINNGIIRLDKRIASKIDDGDIVVKLSPTIKNNLKFSPRPYQEEAFTALDYYLNNPNLRRKPTQLLFHMATGSGKTLIMAGAILELYNMGYRNFIFFVNSDTIIRKTKENFLNSISPKYLFKDEINIKSSNVKIKDVDNFESVNPNDINILFSTIQGLHTRLNAPRENSLTFEDFINKEVVLISDEAHHINTLTKNKLSTKERSHQQTWEYSVDRIVNSNPNNILLEFTATLELNHPNIASKYSDKLLYDYSLAKYREDGYSKEVQTNQGDYDAIDRALVAVLISQFKKKIFASNGLLIKPVIMFKSKTTAESAEIEKLFIDTIKNLTVSNLEEIIKLKNNLLDICISYFKKLDITLQGLIDEIKEDFSEEKIISVNSKNDSEEKQLVINNLEEKNNEYRGVFAVDKLNEGWDVLNLFDIVRLYETRDFEGSKPGKTTMSEAQLIGRGARYCPFKLNESQERYKRKFDNDIDNKLRYCETLHYHCAHNPRYITELNIALRQIGLYPEEKVEVDLVLKDDFKETSFYKNGFIFLNKKVRNTPDAIFEYQEPDIQKKFSINLRTYISDSKTLLDTESLRNQNRENRQTQTHRLINWDKTIIKKGLNSIPFYQFNNLKRYFPSIDSINDFISNSKYLGDVEFEITGLESDIKDLTPIQKLKIVKDIASKISNDISINFGDYRGTETFHREPIRKYFKNKKLSFSINNNSGAEKGKPTMRNDINPDYYVDLNEADWYVYNENYGTSEEKFLVRYLKDNIHELKERFKNIYLIRNERFFKLFRFSDGKATEPDFVLFMTEKNSSKELIYQLFIEPKGEHLLINDIWKEKFLLDLNSNAKVELFENQEFKLIGLPFYNKNIKETEFDEALKAI